MLLDTVSDEVSSAKLTELEATIKTQQEQIAKMQAMLTQMLSNSVSEGSVPSGPLVVDSLLATDTIEATEFIGSGEKLSHVVHSEGDESIYGYKRFKDMSTFEKGIHVGSMTNPASIYVDGSLQAQQLYGDGRNLQNVINVDSPQSVIGEKTFLSPINAQQRIKITTEEIGCDQSKVGLIAVNSGRLEVCLAGGWNVPHGSGIGSLRGFVYVKDYSVPNVQAPEQGVTVVISSNHVPPLIRTTVTDSSGAFSVSDLPVGKYDISVSKDEHVPIYSTGNSSVVVNSGAETVVQDVLLSPKPTQGDGTVIINLVDKITGERVDDAVITVGNVSSNTSSNGQYMLNVAVAQSSSDSKPEPLGYSIEK
jgi:hypothetical protein